MFAGDDILYYSDMPNRKVTAWHFEFRNKKTCAKIKTLNAKFYKLLPFNFVIVLNERCIQRTCSEILQPPGSFKRIIYRCESHSCWLELVWWQFRRYESAWDMRMWRIKFPLKLKKRGKKKEKRGKKRYSVQWEGSETCTNAQKPCRL